MVKTSGKNILFVGDIHGLDAIELLKDGLKHCDTIVCCGDYVDSFFVPHGEQLYNLNNLCTFAREHKDKVRLLLGNHDYAYIYGFSGISGYQYMHASEFQKMFKDNADLFQIAWGYTNPETKKYTLATHAGLTQKYWNGYVLPEFALEGKKVDQLPIHEVLNLLQGRNIIWKVGSMRGGRGTPGPMWADYQELLLDRYMGINQVFGHTPLNVPKLDQFGDDLVACIDSRGNEFVESMVITL